MSRDIRLSFDEWALAKLTADHRMKASNGHAFIHMLKTRCQHCGKSQKVTTRCGGWFQTYLGHLDTILLNLDRERETWNRPSRHRRYAGVRPVTTPTLDKGDVR